MNTCGRGCSCGGRLQQSRLSWWLLALVQWLDKFDEEPPGKVHVRYRRAVDADGVQIYHLRRVVSVMLRQSEMLN